MNDLSDRCSPAVCSPPFMATQMSRYVLGVGLFVFGRHGGVDRDQGSWPYEEVVG